MRKTIDDLYEDYKTRYDGKHKYNFSYFLRVINSIDHHRVHIRPKIKWWSDLKKIEYGIK